MTATASSTALSMVPTAADTGYGEPSIVPRSKYSKKQWRSFTTMINLLSTTRAPMIWRAVELVMSVLIAPLNR
jgi:hypothetical protein